MKNLFLFAALSASVLLFSCTKEKDDDEENPCPIIDAKLVPQQVKDSFNVRYPSAAVITWFNKDNAGYCAYFKTTGIEKLTQFDLTGIFIKEETESNQEGEHEDNTTAGGKNSGGCECEIDD